MNAKNLVLLIFGFFIGWGIYVVENSYAQNETILDQKTCKNLSVWHPDCKIK